jgi:hypothetical protein
MSDHGMNDFSNSPGHQDTWSADVGQGALSTLDQQGFGQTGFKLNSPFKAGLNAYKNRETLKNGANLVKTDLQSINWNGVSGSLDQFKGKLSANRDGYTQLATAAGKVVGIDPVKWLAGTLVSFLIETFQPLEDLLGLVTGNETRMQESGQMWQEVGNAMPPISEYMNSTVEGELASWMGDDGDVARTRVMELGLMMDAMGFLALGMQQVLNMMAGVARFLREKVESLIASGVAWIIKTIVPQVAAATATFGAMLPLCIAMTVAQIAGLVLDAIQAINAAVQFVQNLGQTLDLVWDIFNVFLPFLEKMINVPKFG